MSSFYPSSAYVALPSLYGRAFGPEPTYMEVYGDDKVGDVIDT